MIDCSYPSHHRILNKVRQETEHMKQLLANSKLQAQDTVNACCLVYVCTVHTGFCCMS